MPFVYVTFTFTQAPPPSLQRLDIACESAWGCVWQVEAAVVDEPELVVYKGIFKLASEPRGGARTAALAAAEMVLVSLNNAVLSVPTCAHSYPLVLV